MNEVTASLYAGMRRRVRRFCGGRLTAAGVARYVRWAQAKGRSPSFFRQLRAALWGRYRVPVPPESAWRLTQPLTHGQVEAMVASTQNEKHRAIIRDAVALDLPLSEFRHRYKRESWNHGKPPGGSLCERTIQKIIQRAGDRAGVPGVTYHQLRVTGRAWRGDLPPYRGRWRRGA